MANLLEFMAEVDEKRNVICLIDTPEQLGIIKSKWPNAVLFYPYSNDFSDKPYVLCSTQLLAGYKYESLVYTRNKSADANSIKDMRHISYETEFTQE